MWSRKLWVIGLVLSACLAPACSGDDDDSSGNNNSGSGGSGSSSQEGGMSCDIISLDEVRSTLGRDDLAAPTKEYYAPLTTCLYSSGLVIISYETGMSKADLDSYRQQSEELMDSLTCVDVSGLGDAAYSCTFGSDDFVSNDLNVLDGSIKIRVVSGASIDQEKELITKIMAKL
jgi:hypothetical protein